MQKRHKDRNVYFRELATTSEEYFVPYIEQWHTVGAGSRVLEIGCGEGGNLLPFARKGCLTLGVDKAACLIEVARQNFDKVHVNGTFIAEDIFKVKGLERYFDIIVCHDVFEHIAAKSQLLSLVGRCLRPGGIVFMAFPAWQMPFGGHQQICRSRVLSRLPFVHLLPAGLYRRIARLFGEDEDCILELLSIRQTRVTIEQFEDMVISVGLQIVDRQLWLINPHYKVKFGFVPRRLPLFVSGVPYLRNFLCSSCFYILRTQLYTLLYQALCIIKVCSVQ